MEDLFQSYRDRKIFKSDIQGLHFNKELISKFIEFQVFEIPGDVDERRDMFFSLKELFDQIDPICESLGKGFFDEFHNYASGCDEEEEECFSAKVRDGEDEEEIRVPASKFDYFVSISIGRILLGFSILKTNKNEMNIEALCSAKVKGLGTPILKACESLALIKGIKTMTLSSVINKYGFYKHNGYTETGTGNVSDIMGEVKSLFDKIPVSKLKSSDMMDLVPEDQLEAITDFVMNIDNDNALEEEDFQILGDIFPGEVNDIGGRIIELGWVDTIKMSKKL